MTRIHVVEDDDPQKFSGRVNALLEKGWKLHGAAAINTVVEPDTWNGRLRGFTKTIYAQCLVLEQQEEAAMHQILKEEHATWRKMPAAPTNLPEGHRAYLATEVPDHGIGVEFENAVWKRVVVCANGMMHQGLCLYGWCEDNALSYRTDPIGREYTAKWALFRKIEVTK